MQFILSSEGRGLASLAGWLAPPLHATRHYLDGKGEWRSQGRVGDDPKSLPTASTHSQREDSLLSDKAEPFQV